MKPINFLPFIFFLISLVSFSQQGISYQAIIKDSDGLVLKDSEVSIKFSIIYDTADSSAVYVEEHRVTTPLDGVVNLFIGNGSKLSTGIDFSEIDWSKNVFLKEELDTNGNYETMGTNQIVSVPVAEFSRNTASIFTTSNTIQLGNDEVSMVTTSGIVSATGFTGDGSRLTNVGLGGSIDENGNLKIVDHSPTMTSSQTNNILIGSGVAPSLTDAYNNVAIGTSALASATTTYGNIALGSDALRSSTTAFASSTSSNSTALNVAIGDRAMRNMEEGWVNVAIGSTALLNTNEGSGNIAIGAGTMEDPSHVFDNIALGTDAIHKRQNVNSIAIGKQALFNVTNVPDESNFAMDPEVSNLQEFIQRTDNPSTTLDESAYGLSGNIAIGAGAFASPQASTATITEIAMDNIAIGHMSMNSVTKQTGGNIAIGTQTLPVLENGGGIISIGQYSMNQFNEGYNMAVVGNGAASNLIRGSVTTAIGNQAMQNAKYSFGNVAIGSHSLSSIGKNLDSYYGADGNRNLFANNTSVGYASAFQLEEGQGNTSLGAYTMQNLIGGETISIGDWEYVSGQGNTAVGGSSMHAATGGSWNTALGQSTLANNTTGFNNVALGVRTLHANTEGIDNSAVGSYSLQFNTTGTGNSVIGSHILQRNTVGSNNAAIGSYALSNHLDSNNNVAIGVDAMQGAYDHDNQVSLVATGTYQINNELGVSQEFNHNFQNVAIGDSALEKTNGMWNLGIGQVALQETNKAAKNVAIGAFSLQYAGDNIGNTGLGWATLSNIHFSGNNNLAMGIRAGIGLQTGASMGQDSNHNSSDSNTFLGALSGTNDFFGERNIFLGTNIQAGKDFLYNTVAIGADISPSDDNLMVFGNSSHSKWAFGLATTDTGKAIQVGSDTTNGNGAYLTTGGTWTNGSSILFKTNFIDLSNDWILDKISKLNIRKWDYKNTNETHIGPTSEEFIELFEVGIEDENSHISTIDVSGVALKGVQALIEENQKQKEEIKSQSILINELFDRIIKLESSLNE